MLIVDVAAQAGAMILLAKFTHGVYYQYLPHVFQKFSNSKVLQIAVESVGLRCLSLARHEARLSIRANENHGKALRLTNHRLSHLRYKVDSTSSSNQAPYDVIASILLLALFVVMTSDAVTAHRVWTSHVDGAFSVFTAWSESQQYIETPPQAFQNLLGHLANCLQLSCFQRGVSLPHDIVKLYVLLPCQSLGPFLHHIIDGLVMTSSLEKSEIKSQEYLIHLSSLDANVVQLMQILQETEAYYVDPISKGGQQPICHVYRSHRSAQKWNFLRLIRLRINEAALELATSPATSYVKSVRSDSKHSIVQKDWWQTFSIVSAIGFDIYASVPQYLRGPLTNDRPSKSVSMPDRPDTLHWAHSLILPLATVQASAHTTKTLRPLVEDTLSLLWQATTFPGAVGPEKRQIEDMELKDWYFPLSSFLRRCANEARRAHIFFWC